MKKYNELDNEKTHEFNVLLDAVLNEPNKVKDIVEANRDITHARNHTGENVLHWLAVENHTDGIKLLRSLGSPIPTFALVEAVELGHLETVILLLELGSEVELDYCRRALENNPFKISSEKIRILKSYFKQYEYEI